MAFGNPIDPATPTDADLATGDDEFRQLKAALIERVNSYFNDIDEDPWTVRDDRHRREVAFGTLAARPNPPAETGLIYFATDTVELFVSTTGDPDPEWTEIPLGATLVRGLENELPAEPATDFYWSTDEDKLYIREGTGWTLVNVAADFSKVEQTAEYYPDNVAGTRVMNLQTARRIDLVIKGYRPPDPYDSFVIDIPATELEDLGITIEEIVAVTGGNFGVEWDFGLGSGVFVWAISAQLYNSLGVGPAVHSPPYDTIRIVGVEASEADITGIDIDFQIVVGIIYVPAEEPAP